MERPTSYQKTIAGPRSWLATRLEDPSTARRDPETGRLRRRAKGVRIVLIVIVFCSVLVGWQVIQVTLGRNFHEVLPGKLYRSAQPDRSDLQWAVRRYRIRSVISLRGTCPDRSWYQRESQAVRELGLAKYDVCFSSYNVPAVDELRRLVELLDTCEPPILIHCRRGADRTGLACAVALLLDKSGSMSQAKAQLSWRYGHVSISQAGNLFRVLEMYQDWLSQQGVGHSPDRFRHWVKVVYRPGHCWARLEPVHVPDRLSRSRPVVAIFRVHNISSEPWHFHRSSNRGVHLQFLLRRVDRSFAAYGGAGYFDQTVPRGGAILLTLSIPPVPEPGKYALLVDMADEQHGMFFMFSSTPFRKEYIVGD